MWKDILEICFLTIGASGLLIGGLGWALAYTIKPNIKRHTKTKPKG